MGIDDSQITLSSWAFQVLCSFEVAALLIINREEFFTLLLQSLFDVDAKCLGSRLKDKNSSLGLVFLQREVLRPTREHASWHC